VVDTDLTPDLYALLSDDLRVGVDEGRFRVVGEGQDDKPVVVDATTGRWVKGSGRSLNANDPAQVGRETAFKRSRAYGEVLEAFLPAWRGDSDAAISSLEELVAAAVKLAQGHETAYDVVCPSCEHKHVIQVAAPPNQKMVEFLIKRLAGDATKTINTNTRSEEIVKVMSDQRILHQIEVIDITPEERARRKREVIES